MASYDSLQMRSLMKKGEIGQVVADTPVAIRLRHLGTGSVTSVIVTTATDLTIISDGYTQTYTFTGGDHNYATVGALVDAINAGNLSNEHTGGRLWEAKVLDSLRSYATISQFKAETISMTSHQDGGGTSTNVWDVKVDTNAAKYLAYRLTYDRGFLRGQKKQHRVHLQEFVYYATLGGAGANLVQIHEVNGTVETQIFQDTSVSATKTTTNWASGEGRITANDGNDLVVVLKDGTSLADSAAIMTVVGEIE